MKYQWNIPRFALGAAVDIASAVLKGIPPVHQSAQHSMFLAGMNKLQDHVRNNTPAPWDYFGGLAIIINNTGGPAVVHELFMNCHRNSPESTLDAVMKAAARTMSWASMDTLVLIWGLRDAAYDKTIPEKLRLAFEACWLAGEYEAAKSMLDDGYIEAALE
jgi:hypothetical protein